MQKHKKKDILFFIKISFKKINILGIVGYYQKACYS